MTFKIESESKRTQYYIRAANCRTKLFHAFQCLRSIVMKEIVEIITIHLAIDSKSLPFCWYIDSNFTTRNKAYIRILPNLIFKCHGGTVFRLNCEITFLDTDSCCSKRLKSFKIFRYPL